MSCWVVPAVAAELWGTTIGFVLQQIQNGRVPSKTEYGFVLVDVAPDSPVLTPRPKAERQPTFVEVPRPAEQELPEPMAEDEGEEQEIETGTLSWRATRLATSRKRQAPRPARPALAA